MLLDKPQNIAELGKRIAVFAASQSESAVFQAETAGDPAPHSEFLAGLRISRREGHVTLTLAKDHWLELVAPTDALRAFSRKFEGLQDGDHHHWYAAPMSLIIEADESWPGFES